MTKQTNTRRETNRHGDQLLGNKDTDRGAIVDHENHVVFGMWHRRTVGGDFMGAFQASYAKQSKKYTTTARAIRAANKWIEG